jgi:hypothetical protein
MFRTMILNTLAVAVLFATGAAFGQPAEPPAKPKAADPKLVPPADPKAVAAELEQLRARQRQIEMRIQELLRSLGPRTIVIQEQARLLPPGHPPVPSMHFGGHDCCPEPAQRCCFFARLFHRGGGCGDPCAVRVICCQPAPVVCCCYFGPGQMPGFHIELNPQPLPPRRIQFELNPQPLPPGAPPEIRRVKPITPERTSASLFQEAVSFYWSGDAATTINLLSAAAERDSQDAAVWYFKALAEKSAGDAAAAKESARRGAACELLNHSALAQIGQALERVQGDDRRFLRSMSADLTLEKAQQIAAMPVKTKQAVATK